MYITAVSFFIFVDVVRDPVGDSTGEWVMMVFASSWPIFVITRLYAKVWMACSDHEGGY